MDGQTSRQDWPAPPSEPTLADRLAAACQFKCYTVPPAPCGKPGCLMCEAAAALRAASADMDVRLETECPSCHVELDVRIHDEGQAMVMAKRAASAEPSGVRPAVAAFALAMEERLRKHDATRGPEGWVYESDGFLMSRLFAETDELRAALAQGGHLPNWMAIRHEAADVANFAMMVADSCGALEGLKRAAPVSEPQRDEFVETVNRAAQGWIEKAKRNEKGGR